MTEIISSFDKISVRYDAVFLDVWGCLHNGVRPFNDAVQAMIAYRKRGGRVILVTNSPRNASQVAVQLERIGVARDSYDGITTSGEVTRFELLSFAAGTQLYHIGPTVHAEFFAPELDRQQVETVSLEDADGIVCTGLFDDGSETPEDYTPLLAAAAARQLPMLCVNPDIHVDVGERRIYCAGAIAEAYKVIGGRVLMAGKPAAAIYDFAQRKLEELGTAIAKERLLCIGDGIATDVVGASANGFPCLFVTGGLAAGQTGTGRDPDHSLLEQYLAIHNVKPEFAIGYLR